MNNNHERKFSTINHGGAVEKTPEQEWLATFIMNDNYGLLRNFDNSLNNSLNNSLDNFKNNFRRDQISRFSPDLFPDVAVVKKDDTTGIAAPDNTEEKITIDDGE